MLAQPRLNSRPKHDDCSGPEHPRLFLRRSVQFEWFPILLLLVIVVFRASPADAAVELRSTSSANVGAAKQTSLSWSHTITEGNDRLLVVGVTIRGDPEPVPVEAVTYGPVALTHLTSSVDPASRVSIELWSLSQPPVGAATVTVVLGTARRFAAGATTLHGVSATNPFGSPVSAGGFGPTAIVSGIPSQNDELILGFLSKRGDPEALATGPGQTNLWEERTTQATNPNNNVTVNRPGISGGKFS